MRKATFKIFVLFFVLFLCFDLEAFNFVQNKYENQVAEDFTLQDLEGKDISLSDFKDKAVILFFWATWCPHCRRALSTLDKEQKDMEANDIKLLAIDVGESRERVKNFIVKSPISYPILFDFDMGVARKYEVIGVPTMILISKDGKVISVSNSLPYNYKELLLK